MFESFVFREETISVKPDDLIVTCSDGIAESMNAEEDSFARIGWQQFFFDPITFRITKSYALPLKPPGSSQRARHNQTI
jgi:hypothetical protein